MGVARVGRGGEVERLSVCYVVSSASLLQVTQFVSSFLSCPDSSLEQATSLLHFFWPGCIKDFK